MPSPRALKQVKTDLAALARAWPQPGGDLVFFVEEDHVWLHKIRLPASARGQGTDRLAAVLSVIDRAGLSVCLTADPLRDDEGVQDAAEPTTFDLVRWYMRFGFKPLGPSEDGFLMQRDPQPPVASAELARRARAQKAHDMSHDEFMKRWPPIVFSPRLPTL